MNIGLDIGSTSVGWAVIDENYAPVKLKGKTAVGVRLFEDGKTAADRRSFRTTRRRLNRRKWRLRLLEDFFDPYLSKEDPTFFARLRESNLSPKDNRKRFTGSILFPDKTDSEFFNQYPTIYHLRKALMTENRQFDVREIYLAIHHIVKYRGNFLSATPVSHFDTSKIDFNSEFGQFNELYQLEYPLSSFEITDSKWAEISTLLMDRDIKKIDKQRQLSKLLTIPDDDKEKATINKQVARNLSKAILGYKSNVNELLQSNAGNIKLDFSAADVDEEINGLMGELDENQQSILSLLLRLYSQLSLNGIIPSGMTLSESMIEKYNCHHEHLKLLKKYVETIDKPKRKAIAEAYSQYVGNDPHKHGHISKDDFYKKVKRNLDKSDLAQQIKKLIENEQFMPKQRTNENGVIPYQLHQKELDKIIQNQAKYYPWLAEKNPVKSHKDAPYKLDELVSFRIPYYVGPLITKDDQAKSSGANFAWMVRKSEGQITPWNFEDKVDRVESANRFIRKMTTKDTYLIGEDVLPDHSLLYERFKVLNELNMIRVDGHKLDVNVKQDIYNDLFKKNKRVTVKQLTKYLEVNLVLTHQPQVSGLSDPTKFNNSLNSWIDLNKIFGSEIMNDSSKYQSLEQIIEWSTIFEDKKIFAAKLKEIDWLTSAQIQQLVAKRYQGWGRLSAKLLSGLTDQNGHSIINIMWNSQRTFMEIQSRPEFAEQIKNANQDQLKNAGNYEDVLNEAYTSPQNKKAIRQVIKVVDDIVRAAKQSPKMISIEFARDDEKSHRTVSRLSHIQQVYATTAKEIIDDPSLTEELNNVPDLSDRLYLYFTQLGRDMYTGKKINIDELSTKYDIDHILPQSFIKDDSLDNRVLTSRAINNGKSDTVPGFQFKNMYPFWAKLQKHDLISKRKLEHLITNPDSIDKFKAQGFINRQLVETRQVIKLAANILANRYPDTKIVEVKASLNHQMREDFELIKNRNINDYHHAVDAYLSGFVGQYLYHRYPNLQSYFVYGKFKKFSSNQVRQSLKFNRFNFLYDLKNSDQKKLVNKSTGEVIIDREMALQQLQRVYRFKYMLVSQEVYTRNGAMFDQTIYSADSGKKLIPIKEGKPTGIYGGYSGNKDAYLAIVKITDKRKTKYQVVGIPVRAADSLSKAKVNEVEYSQLLHEVIAKRLTKFKKNRKTGERIPVIPQFKVVIPKIMYRQLIIDGNHQKFTLGSSTYQYNARQLVLSQESAKTLSISFDKANYSDDKANEMLMAVYDDILDKVNKYFSLYDKNKFRERLNDGRELFAKLPVESKFENNKKIATGKTEILNNILEGLHADPSMGDLKAIGFSTPLGFMQSANGINLSKNAMVIYQSPTGLFSRKVYLL